MKEIGLVLGLLLCCVQMAASGNAVVQNKTHTDTVRHKTSGSEYGQIYRVRQVSSLFPVEIKVKGHNLYVVSQHNQGLPVYKETGVFYGLFRLNKGTNWISGLPKGAYIINNRRVEVI